MNNVTPPPPPMTVPPLFVIALSPALDVSQNAVVPPTDCLTELPLLIKVARSYGVVKLHDAALPAALCGSGSDQSCGSRPGTVLPNVDVPKPPAPSMPTIKFWVAAELLVTPTPLIVNANELSVIVNALAPELNTMLFTVIRLDRETPVMLDVANVAVSVTELGTVTGVQLAAVPQSPVAGAAFHVALPAKVVLPSASRNNSTSGDKEQGTAPGSAKVTNGSHQGVKRCVYN